MNPTKCDSSGAVYFRAYRQDAPNAAPVIRIARRDDVPVIIDPATVNDDAISNPKTLHYDDFAVASGAIYIAATTESQSAFVLRFAVGDGK